VANLGESPLRPDPVEYDAGAGAPTAQRLVTLFMRPGVLTEQALSAEPAEARALLRALGPDALSGGLQGALDLRGYLV
jgi:hypothetical protein